MTSVLAGRRALVTGNWIFTRPNATGPKGALSVYGKAGQRPEFDWRRT